MPFINYITLVCPVAYLNVSHMIYLKSSCQVQGKWGRQSIFIPTFTISLYYITRYNIKDDYKSCDCKHTWNVLGWLHV